jgi:hypothetical protein
MAFLAEHESALAQVAMTRHRRDFIHAANKTKTPAAQASAF